MIKHKKIFIFLLVVFFLLVLFIIFTNRTEPTLKNLPTEENKATAANFSELLNQRPASLEQPQSFFLNRIDTRFNVNGYSWNNNQLIYSTPEGIYLADGNQSLTETQIDSISWNAQAEAIYSQNKQWFLFDGRSQETKPIDLDANLAYLHPNKPFLAIQNSASFTVYSLADFNIPIFTINNKVKGFFWASNSPWLAIQTDTVQLVNLSSPENLSIPIPPNSQLIGISPKGDLICLFLPNGQNLILLDQDGNQIKMISLPETKSLVINWLDDQTIIAIATSAPDTFNRITDFIWLISADGQKKFLANSQPITNKLNTAIPVFINADKNVIGLVENKKTLWLLSLLPDQFPNYFQEKVEFFNPSTLGH